MNMIGTHGNDFEIKGNKLFAHGYEWTIEAQKDYVYMGLKRRIVKAKKPRGKKVYQMVIYENNTISRAC